MMPNDEIQVGGCYRLVTGQVVRVNSVDRGLVRCDIYDDAQKTWVARYSPMPRLALKEKVDGPRKGE